jgi:signal transduction histidine kinase
MVRCAFILFSLLLLGGLSPTTVAAEDDPVTVRVGFYENAPKLFTDESGRPSGFWPDIVGSIAAREGWEIEYVPGTWQTCLERLQNGDLDMMPDVAYTAERAALYAFGTEVVYSSWATVYVQPDSSIQSIPDLDGMTVAVLKGSVNADGPNGIKELARAFDIACTFVEMDSYADVFNMVADGEADAGVSNKDIGYQYMIESDVRETPIVFQPSLLYFAFPKDGSLTPYLAEKTDYHIRQMKADNASIYYQSLGHWLAGGPTGEYAMPRWLWITLIAVAALAAFFAIGGYVLRAQVASRTATLTGEIARRREVEEELEQSHGHLEELVRQRTHELEEANLHKSQFLANMSHELRTPLNSIIGYTKLMLDGLEGNITGEQKEDLQTVYDNSKHLLSLINDLLDLSKIEAGKFEIVKEDYPISDIVSLVVPSMEKLAREKGLQLTYKVEPAADTVYADKNKTKQVLFNLLGNAVKFTREGSVRLHVAARDGGTVFSVVDTGIGIDEKDMAVLFESYKQVGPARLDGAEGTGLGLVISKQFVEMQGGRIWVESTPGKGSTFSFSLPARQPDE